MTSIIQSSYLLLKSIFGGGCVSKSKCNKMFQGKKIVDVYSVCVPVPFCTPLPTFPPALSVTISIHPHHHQRKGTRSHLLLYFTLGLPYSSLSGTPQLIRPPRGPDEMLCKCFCSMWEVRSTLEQTSSLSRTLWFSLKGQTVFSKWGLHRTSLSNPLRNISNRATKWFSKKQRQMFPKIPLALVILGRRHVFTKCSIRC